MNKQPLEQAQDRDLRLSQPAMQRAAQRAHDLAKATGTTIVVSRDGVIEHVTPMAAAPPNVGTDNCSRVSHHPCAAAVRGHMPY